MVPEFFGGVAMMKAICFKDVRPGDVVCEEMGEPHEILKVQGPIDQIYPIVVLYIKDAGILQNKPDAIIGLLHRPWPEGKTEKDMLNEVVELALGICLPYPDPQDIALDKLHKASEEYELGKPLEEKPRRNESLVDRHMIP